MRDICVPPLELLLPYLCFAVIFGRWPRISNRKANHPGNKKPQGGNFAHPDNNFDRMRPLHRHGGANAGMIALTV
jgi:hypothetical protein